ncbi:MAG: hypothetical protein ACJA02_000877 [Myxococcota bacterium]|jgi:uncharacterized protein (UPF0128 family)
MTKWEIRYQKLNYVIELTELYKDDKLMNMVIHVNSVTELADLYKNDAIESRA